MGKIITIDVQKRYCSDASLEKRIVDFCVLSGLPLIEILSMSTVEYRVGVTPETVRRDERMLPPYLIKKSFVKQEDSALSDDGFFEFVQNDADDDYLLCGLYLEECVYQTARDLQCLGKRVAILSDLAVSLKQETDHSQFFKKCRESGILVSNSAAYHRKSGEHIYASILSL